MSNIQSIVINHCHAEYFYILHSFHICVMLTCSIPVASVTFQSDLNTVVPDQMASSETS